MQIIMGDEVARELEEKYTILELDTIPIGDKMVAAYCVLEPENIVFEMSTLPGNIELHKKLIEAIKEDNSQAASVIADSLVGRFGGELDSFYEIIAARINTTGSTKFVLP